MRTSLSLARRTALAYLKWSWPVLLVDIALDRLGAPQGWLRDGLNTLGFLWVLCAPVAPLTLLLDRRLRERAMARLCGLREGDERERAVTGEAARATLLLGLSLQVIMLVMSLITVQLVWKPNAPKGERGLLAVGMGFNSGAHLDPFTGTAEAPAGPAGRIGKDSTVLHWDGFLLSPAAFSILALLILAQLAAFKAFSLRRYEGRA